MLPHRFKNHSSAFHRCKAFFGDDFGPKRLVGNGPQKRLLLKAKRLPVVNVEGFAVQKVLPAGGKQSERAAFFELPDFLDNIYKKVIFKMFFYNSSFFACLTACDRVSPFWPPLPRLSVSRQDRGTDRRNGLSYFNPLKIFDLSIAPKAQPIDISGDRIGCQASLVRFLESRKAWGYSQDNHSLNAMLSLGLGMPEIRIDAIFLFLSNIFRGGRGVTSSLSPGPGFQDCLKPNP